ncbi:unnamed protein product [Ambrosiozyma monospora]|uniref:Protoporphyrinogen oxidase n=1 Tax=Ambrosiozyma monospora TaxID=43982 RepID=A0A9W6YMN0_AMBMO|nr:unnamed protein product [Ambrosiozyma monospora]
MSLNKKTIGVLGSGISGLTYAYYLSKLNPQIQVNIFEKAKRSGGFINSPKAESNKDVMFEKGPRTLRGVSEGTLLILDLLDKFKALDKVKGIHSSSIANKKYLLEPHSNVDGSIGTLIELPSSPSTIMKFLSDPICKHLVLGILKEPFVRAKVGGVEETVEQWFTRRFNKQVCDNFVSAMIHGIYAGDASKLSVSLVFPKLVEIEKNHGSIVRYMIGEMLKASKEKKELKKKQKQKNSQAEEKPLEVPESVKEYQSIIGSEFNFSNLIRYLKKYPMLLLQGGLETLPKLIEENLPSNVKIYYGSDVTNIQLKENGKIGLHCETHGDFEFDNLRSTISLKEFSKIVDNSELAGKIDQVNHVGMITCNVYIPNHNRLSSYPGFGFLVPKKMTNNQWKLLGVIFDSEIETNAVVPLYYYHALKTLKSDKINMTSEDVDQDAKEVIRLAQIKKTDEGLAWNYGN